MVLGKYLLISDWNLLPATLHVTGEQRLKTIEEQIIYSYWIIELFLKSLPLLTKRWIHFTMQDWMAKSPPHLSDPTLKENGLWNEWSITMSFTIDPQPITRGMASIKFNPPTGTFNPANYRFPFSWSLLHEVKFPPNVIPFFTYHG